MFHAVANVAKMRIWTSVSSHSLSVDTTGTAAIAAATASSGNQRVRTASPRPDPARLATDRGPLLLDDGRGSNLPHPDQQAAEHGAENRTEATENDHNEADESIVGPA